MISDSANSPEEPIVALLVGGTGLVGAKLLVKLLAAPEYSKVRALVRRPTNHEHEKLETHQVDFEKPQTWQDATTASQVFCCLGTTIKTAGSEQAFRHVDHDLPLEVMRRARERGATALFVVTALGADPSSRIFYNRVKGELERDLKELGYPTVAIFRPSLIDGERQQRGARERIALLGAKTISPLLLGSLRRYRVISADAVAQAMFSIARAAKGSRDPLGFSIYESDAIAELAARG